MTNKPEQDEATKPSITWEKLKLPTTGAGLFNPAGDTTAVAKIPAGWLFKHRHFHGGNSGLTSQAITFIPDALHEWKPLEQVARWESVSRQRTPNFNDWTERLAVFGGWIYKTSLATSGRMLTLSMVYVLEQPDRGIAP